MSEIDMQLELLAKGDKDLVRYERRVDELAVMMLESGLLIDEDLAHEFHDGIYRRALRFPAGVVAISLRHKTTNPFVITKGKVLVFSPEDGIVELSAGDSGVSKAGQRRIGIILEDLEWVSFHPCSDGETVDEIEARIYEDPVLPNGLHGRVEWKRKLALEAEAKHVRNLDRGSDSSSRSLQGEQRKGRGKRSAESREQTPDRLLQAAGEDQGRAHTDAGMEPYRVRDYEGQARAGSAS